MIDEKITAASSRRQMLGATAGLITSAVATGALARETKGPRPAVVLVHGAFADGSCWDEVIIRLQQRGYTVAAVQNPLTSLADDVEATRRVLERQQGPVILVGHSWGGAVITRAGTAPNVAALVYVSALVPDKGETVVDLQRHDPASKGMEGAAPDAQGLLWFDPARYAAGLAGDVKPQRVRVMAATQQPIAAGCFSQPLSAAAWREKPTFYLLSERDEALAPVLQRWMADRAKAVVLTAPSSHMSPVSHPDAVVTLIERAAQARVNSG